MSEPEHNSPEHRSSANGPLPPAQDAAAAASPRPKFPGYAKALLVLLAVGIVLAVVYATPLRSALANTQRIRASLKELGWPAPAVFVSAVAVLVAIGCPRLLLCPIGGFVFGFLPGLLWAQIGTLIGSYGTFLFVRWGGREFVLRKWPRAHRYSRFIAERGALSVFAIRQIPVSGFWISAMLGLTHVGHLDFLLGTAVGTLPAAVPATLAGTGVGQLSHAKGLAYIVAAIVWFAIVWQGFRWYRRHWRLLAAEAEGGTAQNIKEAGSEKGK